MFSSGKCFIVYVLFLLRVLDPLRGLLVHAGSASDRDGLPVASALLLVGVVAPCPGAGHSQVRHARAGGEQGLCLQFWALKC